MDQIYLAKKKNTSLIQENTDILTTESLPYSV